MLVSLVLGNGCSPAPQSPPDSPSSPLVEVETAFESAIEPEAVSLLGEDLPPLDLPADFLDQQSELLAAAERNLEANPNDPDALIWVGRRTAYVGRYREAIDIYARAIEDHPDFAALYRHRGHRYISTRQLDRAIDDLSRAADLVAGQPDEIEADGLPNDLGIPTSTLQSNIYYHLGLAHYLKGDFSAALDAYRTCIEVSPTPDNIVATSHWLYMTLRRLGREEEASAALESITADMEIIENHEYHDLLLMYKGELDAEAMWADAEGGETLGGATVGYGLGNWFLYEGDRDRAYEIFSRILAGDQWSAFGYIAAEAELARSP